MDKATTVRNLKALEFIKHLERNPYTQKVTNSDNPNNETDATQPSQDTSVDDSMPSKQFKCGFRKNFSVEANFDLRPLVYSPSFLSSQISEITQFLSVWKSTLNYWCFPANPLLNVFNPHLFLNQYDNYKSELTLSNSSICYSDVQLQRKQLLLWQESYQSCVELILRFEPNQYQNAMNSSEQSESSFYLFPTTKSADNATSEATNVDNKAHDDKQKSRTTWLEDLAVGFFQSHAREDVYSKNIDGNNSNIRAGSQDPFVDHLCYACVIVGGNRKLLRRLLDMECKPLVLESTTDDDNYSDELRSVLRLSSYGMSDRIKRGKAFVILGQLEVTLAADVLLEQYFAYFLSPTSSRPATYVLPRIVCESRFKHATTQAPTMQFIDCRSRFNRNINQLCSHSNYETNQNEFDASATTRNHKISWEGLIPVRSFPYLVKSLQLLASQNAAVTSEKTLAIIEDGSYSGIPSSSAPIFQQILRSVPPHKLLPFDLADTITGEARDEIGLINRHNSFGPTHTGQYRTPLTIISTRITTFAAMSRNIDAMGAAAKDLDKPSSSQIISPHQLHFAITCNASQSYLDTFAFIHSFTDSESRKNIVPSKISPVDNYDFSKPVPDTAESLQLQSRPVCTELTWFYDISIPRREVSYKSGKLNGEWKMLGKRRRETRGNCDLDSYNTNDPDLNIAMDIDVDDVLARCSLTYAPLKRARLIRPALALDPIQLTNVTFLPADTANRATEEGVR